MSVQPGLYYITGVSATGKSTITKELLLRGYEAYDGDDLAQYYNLTTGELAQELESTDRFYETHQWLIQRDILEALLEKATAASKPIFLCGVVGDHIPIWDLFESVITLTIDEETLKERLLTRTTNNHGKHPVQMARILKGRLPYQDKTKARGSILISCNQPIDQLTDQILNVFDQNDS